MVNVPFSSIRSTRSKFGAGSLEAFDVLAWELDDSEERVRTSSNLNPPLLFGACRTAEAEGSELWCAAACIVWKKRNAWKLIYAPREKVLRTLHFSSSG